MDVALAGARQAIEARAPEIDLDGGADFDALFADVRQRCAHSFGWAASGAGAAAGAGAAGLGPVAGAVLANPGRVAAPPG